MFIVPGILIEILTFPGVIVHELAHQICCYLLKVPVYDVKYFQMKNPCGYVVHEPTDKPGKTVLISVGPFLVNTLIGIIIMLPISIQLVVFHDRQLLTILLAWIGGSILMHAFPSTGDAQVLVDNVLKSKDVSILVKILVAPIIGLIYIGAFGSIVWLDLLYAGGITFLIPKVLLLMY